MLIIGTGLTGLVGSRITELLSNTYQFEHINSTNGINILNKDSVLKAISSSDAKAVIHMAAKTHVDGCELDKKRDKEILSMGNVEEREDAWIKEQTAYAVNVFGTQNVIDACKKTGKKIVYISTDFVFDGTKKHFSEDDIPNPLNWYSKTKYEGEKLIQKSELEYLIVRPAYPYRAYFKKNDFVRAIIEKLKRKEELRMVTDHVMVPTFIDDIVNALDVLLQKEQIGIFHVVGNQSITPYNAALIIAREFNLDENLILKTTRREYFNNKAQRPFCLNLKNDKISKLGVEMLPFDLGLKEIKNQMEKLNI